MKVLLVEDNEMNRDMLSRRLTRRGHTVVTAVDGQAALDQVASAEPQLVLMDLNLPVVDGWETTRRLKANALTRRIPVIALSAHAMAEDRQRALAAGCDDFDTKPVDIDRLLAKMEALVGAEPSGSLSNGPGSVPARRDLVLHASRMADLPALMRMIERACVDAGADDDSLFSIRLAAEEVFTNILNYGYRDGTGPVKIQVDQQPGQIRITFADVAAAFDPATLAAPRMDAPLEDRVVGGWGWHLVRQVMDKVQWKPRETGGNQFTLIKFVPNASAKQPGDDQ